MSEAQQRLGWSLDFERWSQRTKLLVWGIGGSLLGALVVVAGLVWSSVSVGRGVWLFIEMLCCWRIFLAQRKDEVDRALLTCLVVVVPVMDVLLWVPSVRFEHYLVGMLVCMPVVNLLMYGLLVHGYERAYRAGRLKGVLVRVCVPLALAGFGAAMGVWWWMGFWGWKAERVWEGGIALGGVALAVAAVAGNAVGYFVGAAQAQQKQAEDAWGKVWVFVFWLVVGVVGSVVLGHVWMADVWEATGLLGVSAPIVLAVVPGLLALVYRPVDDKDGDPGLWQMPALVGVVSVSIWAGVLEWGALSVKDMWSLWVGVWVVGGSLYAFSVHPHAMAYAQSKREREAFLKAQPPQGGDQSEGGEEKGGGLGAGAVWGIGGGGVVLSGVLGGVLEGAWGGALGGLSVGLALVAGAQAVADWRNPPQQPRGFWDAGAALRPGLLRGFLGVWVVGAVVIAARDVVLWWVWVWVVTVGAVVLVGGWLRGEPASARALWLRDQKIDLDTFAKAESGRAALPKRAATVFGERRWKWVKACARGLVAGAVFVGVAAWSAGVKPWGVGWVAPWLVSSVVLGWVVGMWVPDRRERWKVDRSSVEMLLACVCAVVWVGSMVAGTQGQASWRMVSSWKDFGGVLLASGFFWVGGALGTLLLFGVFWYPQSLALDKADRIRRELDEAGLIPKPLDHPLRGVWKGGWIALGVCGGWWLVVWAELLGGDVLVFLWGLAVGLALAAGIEFAFGPSASVDVWDGWRSVRRWCLVMAAVAVVVDAVLLSRQEHSVSWGRLGTLIMTLGFGMPIAGGLAHWDYERWAKVSAKEALEVLKKSLVEVGCAHTIQDTFHGGRCEIQLPKPLRHLSEPRPPSDLSKEQRKAWKPPPPNPLNGQLTAVLWHQGKLFDHFLREPPSVALVVLNEKVRALLVRASLLDITIDGGKLMWTAMEPHHVGAPAVGEVMRALSGALDEVYQEQQGAPGSLERIAHNAIHDPLPEMRSACTKHLWAEHTKSEQALAVTQARLVEDPASVALHEAMQRGDVEGALAAVATETEWPEVEGVQLLWMRCLSALGDEALGRALRNKTHRLMAKPHAQTLAVVAELARLRVEGSEPWLCGLLGSAGEAQKQGAVWALRDLGSPHSFEALRKVIDDTSASDSLRASARQTLGILIERAGATEGGLSLVGDPGLEGALSVAEQAQTVERHVEVGDAGDVGGVDGSVAGVRG